MKTKNKGGRPRILKANEDWVHVTLNMTPREAKLFDKLKGDRTRTEFVVWLMETVDSKKGAAID
jgi:hypothetical protein